jgi:hypothetical protein
VQSGRRPAASICGIGGIGGSGGSGGSGGWRPVSGCGRPRVV